MGFAGSNFAANTPGVYSNRAPIRSQAEPMVPRLGTQLFNQPGQGPGQNNYVPPNQPRPPRPNQPAEQAPAPPPFAQPLNYGGGGNPFAGQGQGNAPPSMAGKKPKPQRSIYAGEGGASPTTRTVRGALPNFNNQSAAQGGTGGGDG